MDWLGSTYDMLLYFLLLLDGVSNISGLLGTFPFCVWNELEDSAWISLDAKRVKWFIFTYGVACSCLGDLDCGLQDIKI